MTVNDEVDPEHTWSLKFAPIERIVEGMFDLIGADVPWRDRAASRAPNALGGGQQHGAETVGMIHHHREIDGFGPAHCSGIYGADESSAPYDLRKLARDTGSEGSSEPAAGRSPSGESAGRARFR
ncbi:hypothetical protein [Nocardioides panzhihuensis]|uniref:Uncharacterized protein n=1 Tax=Nocardioides panzhihuensis TaxID=860243 RepID=A0A7Z0DR43_9ACTN|nr:hypothetical protein [Nocardioides panzhihuensis]NYI80100.1 hypothetical protein [Nocardioides panzhihuensis]